MEIKVEQAETHKWNFPCYGISKEGLIVLFSEEKTGTVITRESAWKVGYHANDWHMSFFTPFKGKITIEQ